MEVGWKQEVTADIPEVGPLQGGGFSLGGSAGDLVRPQKATSRGSGERVRDRICLDTK